MDFHVACAVDNKLFPGLAILCCLLDFSSGQKMIFIDQLTDVFDVVELWLSSFCGAKP